MQYLIVALLVVVALAAVIVPLLRGPRGAAVGDLDPLPRASGVEGEQPGAGTPPGEPQPTEFPPDRPLQTPPEPRSTPERTVPPPKPEPPGEADVEELPISAPPPPGPSRPLGGAAAGGTTTLRSPGLHARAPSPEEESVLRYRESLRAGTVCRVCSAANPPGSKFCMECGEKLGDAQ